MDLVFAPSQIETWPIDRLRPYARNAKIHGTDQVAKIAASMAKFGWTVPCKRRDIVPFAVEAAPVLSPEVIRATLPPLTRRQLFIALHRLGLITAPEAVAAAATGAVPASLEPLFAALPQPEQTDARVTFAAFQMAYRLDPMTAMIAGAVGLSEAKIDAIWTRFASV